jgi:hypothetical protein
VISGGQLLLLQDSHPSLSLDPPTGVGEWL